LIPLLSIYKSYKKKSVKRNNYDYLQTNPCRETMNVTHHAPARSYSTATYAGRHDGVYMSNKEKRKGEESMSGVYHFHHFTL